MCVYMTSYYEHVVLLKFVDDPGPIDLFFKM